MTKIKINTCPMDSSFYLSDGEWKSYIYAPVDEFDETFIVYGNPDYKGVTSASWYKSAIDYLEKHDILPTETDDIIKALKELYPDTVFDRFHIIGYSQGEWQDVIYKADAVASEIDNDFKDAFGNFYFGYVTEIINEDDNIHTYIGDDEYFVCRDDANFINVICEYVGVDPDDVVVYEDDDVIYGQDILDREEEKRIDELVDRIISVVQNGKLDYDSKAKTIKEMIS